MAHGTAAVSALLQATRTIPIVFPVVSDPVGSGLVDSLARPGGNATGFLILEYELSGKWLELLKQIAPNVTRAAVIRDTARPSGIGEYGALASVAQSFRTELTPVSLQDPAAMERAIGTFARAPNGGLIVTTSGLALDYCDLIVALAARYKLPAVYYERSFVTADAFVSLGEVRQITVIVGGEVKTPGRKRLSAFATVIDALSGNLAPRGAVVKTAVSDRR